MAGNISVLLFAFKIKVIECKYFVFFVFFLGNTNTDHFEESQFFLQQKYMQFHFQYKDYTFSGYFKVIHGFKNDFFLLFMAKYLKKSFGQGNSVITADVE